MRKTKGTANEEAAALKALQVLPGVGPSIARDLFDLGFRRPEELRGADPETLYERSCVLQGVRIDRCLLYVYRCAIHVTEHPEAPEELRKWWNWKDGRSETWKRKRGVRKETARRLGGR
jgi:hypothetical protein